MNFSRLLRRSVAILLPLTLAWKIAIPPYNPDDLKGELVGFFERNGFNVVVTDQLVDYVPIIQANSEFMPPARCKVDARWIEQRSHSIAY